MRPAGRGELDSLYFSYPHFPPPDAAARARTTFPVVIVGAGPVGLVAALTLARAGVDSVVVERKTTYNDGSRAICISRSSFQILDALGAVGPFLDKSLGWTRGITSFRGTPILEFEMPHSEHDKYLPMYNLQQQYIEQFLHEATVASGRVDVRWGTTFEGLEESKDGVTITVSDARGTYRIDAAWLLAADGARSAVRQHLGLRLKGDNHEGRYVIADVRMRHDFPTIRRALFDPPSNPGATVLIHRQPDDIWRIDYQVDAGESSESATAEEKVRAKVAAVLGDIGHKGPWELEWWSVYSANTLALDDYRHGRVVFIGDSAHIVPIFGVRGLNNGIADAQNIGWKLAKVIKGQAGAGLIASYTLERRGATLDVFATATKSTRFMTPPTPGWTLVRDAALSLSLKHPFARPLANPRQMAPYDYALSPLTQRDSEPHAGGPRPGVFAHDVQLAPGRHLLDGTGMGFTGLLLSRQPVDPDVARVRAVDPDFRLVVICHATDPASYDAVRSVYGETDRDSDFVLIRPDFYIAARRPGFDPTEVASFLTQLLALSYADTRHAS
ncbi:MAG TPA: FAD-dependent monooxygenase [Hyphomicrobiaceae bacterium]|nr:FAD-dependent monooxygenase [Hyphomicrobiaceae bacterium]